MTTPWSFLGHRRASCSHEAKFAGLLNGGRSPERPSHDESFRSHPHSPWERGWKFGESTDHAHMMKPPEVSKARTGFGERLGW